MSTDQTDVSGRMRAYKIFMGIRASGVQSEVKHDDAHVVETRRVMSLSYDKPSGVMKKRQEVDSNESTKKGSAITNGRASDAFGGGSATRALVMKCVVYELDTSV